MQNPIIELLDRSHVLVLANNTYKYLKYLTNTPLRQENKDFIAKGAPDGLPLPPPELVFQVTGHYAVKPYYESGALDAEAITQTVSKHGADINNFSAILDFGCGVSRTLRNFHNFSQTEICGTDYNPTLIDWCKNNLNFAKFTVNKLVGKLNFPENKFDLIYLISVFTHLPEDAQKFWLEEFKRILKPGGLLYISVQGTTRVNRLNPDEQKDYEAGKMIARYQRYQGSNVCGAYHSEKYIRENWTNGFEVLEIIPGGAKGSNQDVVLLKKI